MVSAEAAITSRDILVTSPLFLVGCERSGTTVTLIILNHHRQIAFDDFYFAVEALPDAGGWPDLESYYAYLDSDRNFRSSRLEVDRSLDYIQLVNSFLKQKQARAGKPIIGGKIRENYDRILRIWPDARFIHLLRDGRDVARSLIPMGWVGNMYTAAQYWLRAEEGWDRLCELVPEDRRTELRYEDMVSDPERTLSGLCDFVGVPFDPGMLDYPRHSTYGPLTTSSIHQWKKLSKRDVQMCESQIGDMLVRRGYELSGHPPLDIEPVLERKLRSQDRWYRARFRLKRYGPALFLADCLSRRLGVKAVERRARERINQIDTQYLK